MSHRSLATMFLMAAVAAFAGCNNGSSHQGGLGGSMHPIVRNDAEAQSDASDAADGPVCGSDGGACAVPSDCDGYFTAGDLPAPWWESQFPASCLDSVQHEQRQYYDDCTGGDQSYGADCFAAVSGRGAIVCVGNLSTPGKGYTSSTCRSDLDCPSSMTCVDVSSNLPGHCEQKCGASTPCVRCDQYCAAGYCYPKGPPGFDPSGSAPKSSAPAGAESSAPR